MSSVEFHVLCVEVGLDLGCHVVIGVALGFTRRRNILDGHVVIGVVVGFTTKTQYQVQSSFLLNIVVHNCALAV